MTQRAGTGLTGPADRGDLTSGSLDGLGGFSLARASRKFITWVAFVKGFTYIVSRGDAVC